MTKKKKKEKISAEVMCTNESVNCEMKNFVNKILMRLLLNSSLSEKYLCLVETIAFHEIDYMMYSIGELEEMIWAYTGITVLVGSEVTSGYPALTFAEEW